MQEFRKQKGRDPEHLQVIGKADTGVERGGELEKDYQSAITGLERQGWNEGAAILDQGSVSVWRRLPEERRNQLAQTILVGKGEDEVIQELAKAEEGVDCGLLSENKTAGKSLARTESRLAALTTATARERPTSWLHGHMPVTPPGRCRGTWA